jgi:hypothetical protein
VQGIAPIQTFERTNRVIEEFEAVESGHGIGEWSSAREQPRRNSVERDESGSRNRVLLHKLFAENREWGIWRSTGHYCNYDKAGMKRTSDN